MTIAVFYFQPFQSRADQDVVIGLRFAYDAEVVAALKDILRPLHARTRDEPAHIGGAGGWLAEARSWFVELRAWPLVRAELLARGYRIGWTDRPPSVRHYGALDSPAGAQAPAPADPAPHPAVKPACCSWHALAKTAEILRAQAAGTLEWTPACWAYWAACVEATLQAEEERR